MRTEVKLFLTIWLVYFVFVVPGGGANPNRYFDLIHSIVDQQTIEIDAYHENTIDKAFRDGHYYSAGLVGPSLIGIPAYLTFKVVYGFVPPSLLKAISGIQSFKQGNASGIYQTDTAAFFLSTIWITWLALMPLSAFGAIAL